MIFLLIFVENYWIVDLVSENQKFRNYLTAYYFYQKQENLLRGNYAICTEKIKQLYLQDKNLTNSNNSVY